MCIAGSNSLAPNPSEDETLAPMGKLDRDQRLAEDQSGGESSESLEEITAEDFKQQDTARSRSRSRVWMDCHIPRDYTQRLSSFAWAQGVQNKPIGLELMPMTAGDLAKSDGKEEGEENDNLVIDVSSQEFEMEEGEIEEGEIECGTERELLVEKQVVVDSSSDELEEKDELDKNELAGVESEDNSELDKNVAFILEELDAITAEEAEA